VFSVPGRDSNNTKPVPGLSGWFKNGDGGKLENSLFLLENRLGLMLEQRGSSIGITLPVYDIDGIGGFRQIVILKLFESLRQGVGVHQLEYLMPQ